AYLPISPELPLDRIKHMLRDSRALVLIAEQDQSENCQRLQRECPDLKHILFVSGSTNRVPLRFAGEQGFEGAEQEVSSDVMPTDCSRSNTLGYVIYTSGTTGLPKGVMVEQQAILRLVLNANYIHIGPGDCVGQASTLAFDAATFEIWGALLNGAALHML